MYIPSTDPPWSAFAFFLELVVSSCAFFLLSSWVFFLPSSCACWS